MAITDITQNTKSYTVVKGDVLSKIISRCITVGVSGFTGYSKWQEGVPRIQKLNPDIENIDLIYVGQVIILNDTAAPKTTNNTQRVKITNFGLQSDTDRTVFATWAWTKNNTDHYEVKWKYSTGDGVLFEGVNENVTVRQSVYSNAPNNAEYVAFYVRPISKTYKKGDKDVHYWTADWSTVKKYYFKDNPPNPPGVPTVTISDDNKLTAKLENIDANINAKEIQFQIVKNDTSIFRTVNAKITATNTATCSCTVQPGSEYKVRCRSVRNGIYSDWSTGWSASECSTPATSNGIHTLRVIKELSTEENQFTVEVGWYEVADIHGYQVQYTTDPRYFEAFNNTGNNTGIFSVTIGSKDYPADTGYTIISENLVGGNTYYFRVRTIKESTSSKTKYGAWCDIEAIVLGEKPSIPTTWSSSTTVGVGKPLTLYWIHNSADGSRETSAILELTIDGETERIYVEKSVDPDKKDENSYYEIDTSIYEEGTKIEWQVKTAGVLTDDDGYPAYGESSIKRIVEVYADPTLALFVTDYRGATFTELNSYPINVSAIAGPNTQKPIGYHLTIIAKENYETVDNMGNKQLINEGTTVYSKMFDISDNPFEISLSAGDVNLANNRKYRLTCTVAMDSGLTTEESVDFTVVWDDAEEYWPNAEIVYDSSTCTTSIKPYCKTETDELINGITLSVYRREFDGSFVELATGLNNVEETYITDPHPSLDYARYRIVAITESTGAVVYYDVPGVAIDEKSVILQWDEDWVNFNVNNEAEYEQPAWSGSLLKLMYNIDISDQHEKEKELIKYIGRDHPVSYYGTQVGHTATWNMVIPKDDEDTLYALRRLARWRGDVYVREPSGSGYWASIEVSFNQTHNDLTIPITLSVTRVEGGI